MRLNQRKQDDHAEMDHVGRCRDDVVVSASVSSRARHRARPERRSADARQIADQRTEAFAAIISRDATGCYAQAVIQTMRADEHERGCLQPARAKDNSPAIYRWVCGGRRTSPARDERNSLSSNGTQKRGTHKFPALKRWAIFKLPLQVTAPQLLTGGCGLS